ncbi:hypothetical protein SEA_NAIRB_45 [Mycobacterium phage Nairb]|uniref:Uncharacterized protein n=5 Tax=Bernalvirus bernal13 TaxID=1982102 RepID=A0A2P1JRS1_9CAUD|nr:hypothetical protein FH37_gp45 [Mycobacterium phage Bernal13]AIT13459.1 hypothetical protein PBI_RONRAYGUN_46 [Mycobacterium phage RonRayGun]ASJ79126.1 hypothetical protein SEA_ZENTIME222_45 [Mycobacterium phage ZenTime222]AVO21833.1 hypothetical protein SEA_NAIRB_45 [Mycobacterium phage Nairb]QBP28891.1 hypothetical protein SEA_IBRAHIM_46 [Mycobacterium phage Ibrahim]QHB47450.1 hypothetical protein SEA_WHITTY_45 [Mycobacterium phage Whitty]
MVPPTSALPPFRVGGPPVTGQCICTHYATEHNAEGQCLARDLFGDLCDCPGFEPEPDEVGRDE